MINEILNSEFNLIKNELIALHDAKGMRASGKWAGSLKVSARNFEAILTGEPYSLQLEQGRAAGKFPPISDIIKWIEEKGVFAQALQSIKITSLAFLIARKIANDGWKREGFGGVELISEIVTEQRIQNIIDKIGQNQIFTFISEIENLLKPLANA